MKQDRIRLVIILAGVFLLRLPFAWVPIQHPDEGTYLTYGAWTALQNAVFGIEYLDGRGPGGYLFYALLTRLFGFGNTLPFHIVGVLFQVGITYAVYATARLLFSVRVSLVSALFYGVFSFAFNLGDSLFLNVEALAALPLMMSIWLFLSIYSPDTLDFRACEDRGNRRMSRIVLSIVGVGFLLGIVFSIRQSMAIALAQIGILLLLTLRNSFSIGLLSLFSLGISFVVGAALGYGHSLMNGGLQGASYASILHGFKYSMVPWRDRLISLISRFVWFGLYQPLMWVGTFLAIMGVQRNRGVQFIAVLFLLQAFGMLVMGRVAAHYFFSVLPFAAILLGYAYNEWFPENHAKAVNRGMQPGARSVVLAVGCLVPVVHFLLFPASVTLPEYSMAAYIREASSKDDPISRAAAFVDENVAADASIQAFNQGYSFMGFYVLAKRLPVAMTPHSDFSSIWRLDDVLVKIEESRPAAVVVPSKRLGGHYNAESPEVTAFLAQYYDHAERFEWGSPSQYYRFHHGKDTSTDPEYIDVYLLRGQP